MTCDLEQLGATGFQDLAAALAVQTFGAGVQVMGSGRDGGRDMYFKGPLVWAKTPQQDREVWEGYTVFQVKHKEQLAARPEDNASWLWQQVRAELEKWADNTSGRGQVPDHPVIITNVPLSPVPGSGGHDQLNKAVKDYIDGLRDNSRDVDDGAGRKAKLARISRLRKWRFWDENQIQTLLRLHAEIRRAFDGFLTAADVFANLAEFTDALPLDQLEPGLRAHARTTLIGEGLIYFDEAGGGDGTGIPVHEIAIDLPVTVGEATEHTSVIRYVLDRGEHILRPTLTAHRGPRHLIVAGAPGNGKTTISKFLVQAYRAAMLHGAAALSAEHQAVISGTTEALTRMGSSLPQHRRWAMRIDLAEYAQDHGSRDESTLIRYIAERVSKRSDLGQVKPAALASWLRQWPWFLMLDGLDEVTEPTIRKRLIQRVTEFVTNADGDDCDVLVVLTTRPMGYAENIAPTQFQRIDLDYLEPNEAVRYGTLATRVRLRNDVDRIERVVRQLHKAAEDDALRYLLRTPLQVLILTIIVGAAGQLAPDRFSLFWGYYEAVFRRERDKQQVGLQRILQEHGHQIRQLHERVGFELQVRSEAADRSVAALTAQELEHLTWGVLEETGFKPAAADAELLAKIVQAATHRLVLIVPRGEEGYGFDVRSLQELMAAMYLTTGLPEVVTARLRTAAPNPHWRNTWIFAAGSLFASPQAHHHQTVVDLVESIDDDADGRLGNVAPIGPRLALDLIDDGMTRSLPKWRNRLIAQGLQVLREPAPPDLLAIARILVRFADISDDHRRIVAEGLRDALSGPPTTSATATQVQGLVRSVAMEIDARQVTKWLDAVRERPGAGLANPSPGGWTEFEEELATWPAPDDTLMKLQQAAVAIRNMKGHGGVEESDTEAIANALADGIGAKALAAALDHVAPHEPKLTSGLRDIVLPPIHREAIGEQLRRP